LSIDGKSIEDLFANHAHLPKDGGQVTTNRPDRWLKRRISGRLPKGYDPLERGRVTTGARSRQTTSQLDTLFQNPNSEDVTSIEVIDPSHPLFGRRFEVISISHPLNTSGHVFVRYRQKMVLRIPTAATALASPRTDLRTKLTSQALAEFISLADQCEVLCQPNHKISGTGSLQSSNKKSSRTSRRSSKR